MGSNQEDIRKLHAEVNQILNQRFLLTTTGITVFGIIGTWLIPKNLQCDSPSAGQFIFFGSTLLMTFLLVLYWYSDRLRKMFRIITTYLEVVEESPWEKRWVVFRKDKEYKHFAYTKSQATIFLFLVLLSTAYPWVICSIFQLTVESKWKYIEIPIGCVYCFVVFFLGFKRVNYYEKRANARWKKIIEGEAGRIKLE